MPKRKFLEECLRIPEAYSCIPIRLGNLNIENRFDGFYALANGLPVPINFLTCNEYKQE